MQKCILKIEVYFSHVNSPDFIVWGHPETQADGAALPF